MSNGKKFILMVSVIVIPFVLVFGVVLGVIIVRGGDSSHYSSVYLTNKISNEDIKSQIVGVWDGAKSDSSSIEERLEFFSDSTFLYSTIFKDKGDSIDLQGSYTFSGTRRIKFVYTSGHIKGDTKIGDISIENDNMVFAEVFGFISPSFKKID